MIRTPLPTTLVGSYVQPDWLIDRERLRGRLPPRVRARELWRVPEDLLKCAQDDATALAVFDQLRAGIDIIGDGEVRRESYSNRLANALEGIDIDNPGTAVDRTGKVNPVPRVVGPIRRRAPIESADIAHLRRLTDKPLKITLPGPFTMAQQAQNDYYPDERSLALAYAEAVNEEVRDLFAAGVDVVQLDEPYVQARAEKARAYAVEAINRAVAGARGLTALHNCFGYARVPGNHTRKPDGYSFLAELAASAIDVISIEAAQPRLKLEVLRQLGDKIVMLGVLDLADLRVETPQQVAERIHAGLDYLPAERLWVAPDCGLKYLPREVAWGKMRAMVLGAALVRNELFPSLSSSVAC
ncbi:MAG: cobalamin-independent methionine synthase II family protein, partial [Burkholderiales bacterium]|nr:cobalamin-independent methionine synthase II family protein [Burkholderiales bacterium]